MKSQQNICKNTKLVTVSSCKDTKTIFRYFEMRHLECQGLGGADIRAHFTFDFEEINILWVNHVERFSQNHKHKKLAVLQIERHHHCREGKCY